LESADETALRKLVVPLVWLVHIVPPSVVRRMVPASPTAVPVRALVNETALRKPVVPLDWLVHVAPASVV